MGTAVQWRHESTALSEVRSKGRSLINLRYPSNGSDPTPSLTTQRAIAAQFVQLFIACELRQSARSRSAIEAAIR
jgi:hypothetical protein